MSALQSGELTPLPYLTQNLAPPNPHRIDDEPPLTIFAQKNAEQTQSIREAEVAKALAQEALRWEQGSLEREAKRHLAATRTGQILLFPDQTEL